MPLFGPPNIEKLRAKRDVKGLIKALGYQKTPNVRKAAAAALGQIGDPRAVEPLVRALQDEDRRVREATGAQLEAAYKEVHVGEEAIVALKQILEHAAADIPLADLGAVVHLNTVVQVRIHSSSGCNFSTYSREPVDTSQVRQLARQELIRRGIQA